MTPSSAWAQDGDACGTKLLAAAQHGKLPIEDHFCLISLELGFCVRSRAKADNRLLHPSMEGRMTHTSSGKPLQSEVSRNGQAMAEPSHAKPGHSGSQATSASQQSQDRHHCFGLFPVPYMWAHLGHELMLHASLLHNTDTVHGPSDACKQRPGPLDGACHGRLVASSWRGLLAATSTAATSDCVEPQAATPPTHLQHVAARMQQCGAQPE